jgi:hypothetical protein
MRSLALASCFTVCICACVSVHNSSTLPQGNLTIPSNEQLFVSHKFQLPLDPALKPELHNGEPLDLSVRRPVVSLEGSVFQTVYGKANYRLVGNVFHRGHFYIARLPLHAVQNTYYQLASSTDATIQSLLRFEFPFEQPVELVAKMPDESALEKLRDLHTEQILEAMPKELSGDEYRIRNLALSVEPQWSKKDPNPTYDNQRAELGAYVQIIRLVSMEVRFEEFFALGSNVTQIKLAAPPEEIDRLLEAAIVISQQSGVTHPYNQTSLSGATVAVELLNSVLTPKRQVRALASKVHVPEHPRVHDITRWLNASALSQPVKTPAMQKDHSLSEEAHIAFQDAVVLPHRDVCPISMSRDLCQNITQTVKYYHLPLN